MLTVYVGDAASWLLGACVGHRSRLAPAGTSGGAGSVLTVRPGRIIWRPSTTLLAGLDARFEHAEALVDEARHDLRDGHLALLVDDVDGRTSLGLDNRMLGDDDGVLGLTDLDVSLHILAGQDDLLRG